MSRRFQLTDAAIRKALDALAGDHTPVAQAIAQVGYPLARRREHSFESLARIVMGQQLSVKAAATIAQRVDETVGGALQPKSLLATSPDKLRAAGLSRQKIGYLQSLAEAVISGDLPDIRQAGLASLRTSLPWQSGWPQMSQPSPRDSALP